LRLTRHVLMFSLRLSKVKPKTVNVPRNKRGSGEVVKYIVIK